MDRSISAQEYEEAPAGIIDTPDFSIEKTPEGRARFRGFTEQGRRKYQQLYETERKRFGPWRGSEDPNAPPPPIRPNAWSFNPDTGKWIEPRRAR
jgi:hypothetical protein